MSAQSNVADGEAHKILFLVCRIKTCNIKSYVHELRSACLRHASSGRCTYSDEMILDINFSGSRRLLQEVVLDPAIMLRTGEPQACVEPTDGYRLRLRFIERIDADLEKGFVSFFFVLTHNIEDSRGASVCKDIIHRMHIRLVVICPWLRLKK